VTTNVSTARAARLARVSARQLSWWTGKGLLFPIARNQGGSGIPFAWPPGEVIVAARMGRLMEAGLDLEIAADMARRGERRRALSDEVEVVVVVATKDCTLCLGTGHIAEPAGGGDPVPFDPETQMHEPGLLDVWVCPNCFWVEGGEG